MGRAASATADPTLQRLHEVAERIRRRAAEARTREAARSAPPPAPDAPPAVPPSAQPPRHWSDGPVDEGDDVTHH
jgi:hypothetical protein